MGNEIQLPPGLPPEIAADVQTMVELGVPVEIAIMAAQGDPMALWEVLKITGGVEKYDPMAGEPDPFAGVQNPMGAHPEWFRGGGGGGLYK
jgi:hypothetical protein